MPSSVHLFHDALHRERQRVELARSDLVLKSQAMREAWERIKRASRTNETLLLRGESGTGKSFMAKKVHELSERRDKAFVVVGLISDIGSDNLIQSDLFGHERGAFTGATATKQGLFSLADGGTIFLDEIGDASPELQAKLLRVLESSTFKRLGSTHDMQVDVHVIAATNRNLEKMLEERTFRKDLYYRLNVIPLELPPLRERPEDIPAMAEFFLAHAVGGRPLTRRFAPGLVARLKDYTWPGNIRELDHALKYAAAMASGEEITLDDFPDALRNWLEGARPAPAVAVEEDRSRDGPVVHEQRLRRAIRSSEALPANEDRQRHEIPAHIESAKRIWLATLLDEFGGDLGMVACYWDRSSEKTLRKLIRSYGLTDRLAEARRRKRSKD